MNFVYIDGITSYLAKKSRDSPDFRQDNIAGPHGSRELNADAKNLILIKISTQASCICRKLGRCGWEKLVLRGEPICCLLVGMLPQLYNGFKGILRLHYSLNFCPLPISNRSCLHLIICFWRTRKSFFNFENHFSRPSK